MSIVPEREFWYFLCAQLVKQRCSSNPAQPIVTGCACSALMIRVADAWMSIASIRRTVGKETPISFRGSLVLRGDTQKGGLTDLPARVNELG
jgi:hypothetical protein